MSIFPAPYQHGLVCSALVVLHYIIRTHYFMEHAAEHQRMMNHSIAECTICAFKGLVVISVFGLFRMLPEEGQTITPQFMEKELQEVSDLDESEVQ